MARVFNFSAGPAVLPEEVLKQAAAEMLDYQGSGMSVMEMSHRSKTYQNILRKEQVLVGTWNSSYSERENDWVEALDAVSKGELALLPLITHKASIAEAADAIKMMYERTEFYCKVMIDNEK